MCPAARHQLEAEPLWSGSLEVPGLDQVFIRGSYDCLVLQQLIHRVKYSYWWSAGEAVSEILKPLVGQMSQLPPNTVIVPVPLHRRRILERGFNQSLLIAQSLNQLHPWPIKSWLRRQRYTKPQAQLTAGQRTTNVIDAFSMAEPFARMPASAILVDDVLTTGSTLSECAKVLKASGVKHVYACTVAKG